MKPFSDLSPKDKAIEVLRWVLVLPVAVFAGIVPGLIARAMLRPVLAQLPGTPVAELSDFRRFVLPHLLSILVAAAFVIAGAKTASQFRLQVALGLALVCTLYSFMSHVLVHLGRGKPHYTVFAVAIVAAGCGAGFIWYSEKKAGPR